MKSTPHQDSCLWNVTALRRKRRALDSCRGWNRNQNGSGTLESNLEAWGQGSNALKTLSTRNLTLQSTEELNIPVFSVMWRIKKLTSHGPFLKKTMLKDGLCDNEEVNRGKGRRKSMRRSNIGKRISRARVKAALEWQLCPRQREQPCVARSQLDPSGRDCVSKMSLQRTCCIWTSAGESWWGENWGVELAIHI